MGLLPVFKGLAAAALLLALNCISAAILESVGEAAAKFNAKTDSVVDLDVKVWSTEL